METLTNILTSNLSDTQSRLALIWAMLTIPLLIILVKRWRLNHSRVKHAHGSAKWATDKEINEMGLIGDKGIVLGITKNNQYLRYNMPAHTAVVARTRAGKGVGVIIPTLLTWPDSVIVVDPKFENWRITSGFRSYFTDCYRFSPTTEYSHYFNPLTEVRPGINEMGDIMTITSVICGLDSDKLEQAHWQDSAWSLLTTIMMYVIHHHPRKSLSGMLEVLNSPEHPIKDILEEMLDSDYSAIRMGARNMLNKHDEEFSSIVSTASRYLSLYFDPIVAGNTDASDFGIQQLMQADKPVSLYLSIPPKDIARAKDLFRLIITLAIYRLAEVESNPNNKRELLIVFDEFPAFGKIGFFESALSFLAGYGIKVMLIAQNINQIYSVYGNKTSVLDQCECKCFFTPSDMTTAKEISNLLGQYTIEEKRKSISDDRRSWSESSFGRPLLMADEIARLPLDDEIIKLTGKPPIKANRIKYFEDNNFIKRANLNEPKLRKVDLSKPIATTNTKNDNTYHLSDIEL